MNMSVKEWDIIEENEEIKKDFQGFTKGLVRFGDQGWTFKPKTAEWIAEFQVGDSVGEMILDLIFPTAGSEGSSQ